MLRHIVRRRPDLIHIESIRPYETAMQQKLIGTFYVQNSKISLKLSA